MPAAAPCAPKGYRVPRRGIMCPEGVSRAPKGYRVPRRGIVCPEGVSRAPKGYERQTRNVMLIETTILKRNVCVILYSGHKKDSVKSISAFYTAFSLLQRP